MPCRGRALGRAKRKYHFTPELLEELFRAYCGNKRELSAALDVLQRKTHWPRWAFKLEARRRGWITADHRRPWTREEIERLREMLGTRPVKAIARALGRSPESVEAKAEKLRLSRRVREGYTIEDLAQCFGTYRAKVRHWIERGLLGRPVRNGIAVRVHERSVLRFIREHAAEYDLRRVDQTWFKGMVFAPWGDGHVEG